LGLADNIGSRIKDDAMVGCLLALFSDVEFFQIATSWFLATQLLLNCDRFLLFEISARLLRNANHITLQ
jgi:hypothetical protein